MKQFATPKTFQAKPSLIKKKIAQAAFVLGALSFTLAVTGMIGKECGAPLFAGGITSMALAFRFWNMQVRGGPMAVTFDESGITIANRSSRETIAWAELESIRYCVWRGGHYWEFRSHHRSNSVDYYVDGLTSAELDEFREAVSSIHLPGVVIEPFYNPLGFKGLTVGHG